MRISAVEVARDFLEIVTGTLAVDDQEVLFGRQDQQRMVPDIGVVLNTLRA